jgi:hypothetical protein
MPFLKRAVKGISLRRNAKHTDYSYGTLGIMIPGEFEYIPAIGINLPPAGSTWVRDCNLNYWEVADADLREALRD